MKYPSIVLTTLALSLPFGIATSDAGVLKLNVLGTASSNGYVGSDSGISGSGSNLDPAGRISSLTLVWNSLDIDGDNRKVVLGIDGTVSGADVDLQDVGGTNEGLNVWGAVNRPGANELFKITIGIFDGLTDVTDSYTIAVSDIESYVQTKSALDMAWIIGSSKFEFNPATAENTKQRIESTLITGGPAAITGGAFDIDHTSATNGQLLHLDGIEFTVTQTPGSASFAITSITEIGGGVWELTLDGEADTAYEFRSSPTLDFTPGALVENLAAGAVPVGAIGGPNNSVLTTDGNGDGTVQMALSGSPADFVRAQIPPPVTVLSEDFDGDEVTAPNLPTDWTTNTPDPATTLWELGSPTVVGPPAANSGANCVGTNLAANYGLSSEIWLRTPPIDLSTATGATLTFQHWVDIDPFETGGVVGDKGTVRVLDASALPTVSVLETLGADITGLSPAGWVEFSADFTEFSLGNSVVLEFLFVSDADDDGGAAVSSGWYIDDVIVTVP